MGFAPVTRRALTAMRSTATKAPELAQFAIEEKGAKDSLEYRIHFSQSGGWGGCSGGRRPHACRRPTNCMHACMHACSRVQPGAWAHAASSRTHACVQTITSAQRASHPPSHPPPPPFHPSTGKQISCWHEIPLYAGDGMLHFICEIPKETSAKMEVATVSSSCPFLSLHNFVHAGAALAPAGGASAE